MTVTALQAPRAAALLADQIAELTATFAGLPVDARHQIMTIARLAAAGTADHDATACLAWLLDWPLAAIPGGRRIADLTAPGCSPCLRHGLAAADRDCAAAFALRRGGILVGGDAVALATQGGITRAAIAASPWGTKFIGTLARLPGVAGPDHPIEFGPHLRSRALLLPRDLLGLPAPSGEIVA